MYSFSAPANSARSQIAEALLTRKGAPQFIARSAGVHPRPAVHPDAENILREYGIDWSGHRPKSIDAVRGEPWDFVITVCDRAKESCPTFPGHPIFAHWGMPDPADIEDDEQRHRAFVETVQYLSRRVDLILALPFEKLERHAVEERLRRIGQMTPDTTDSQVPD